MASEVRCKLQLIVRLTLCIGLCTQTVLFLGRCRDCWCIWQEIGTLISQRRVTSQLKDEEKERKSRFGEI